MEHDIRHEGYDYDIIMVELERLGLKLRHPRMHGPSRSQWDESIIQQYIEKVLEKNESMSSSSDNIDDRGHPPNVTIPKHFLIRAERSTDGCALS